MPPFKLDEIKLKDEIVKDIDESKRYYAAHFAMVDSYIKRYEAKRSISGLMGWGENPEKNPKNDPWDNASDIGIPIEAFTIEGLLPRFLKVCYGAKPIVWVRGRGESDMSEAEDIQEGINFQLNSKIKIYRSQKLTFKNTTMGGDGIAKCVWEEQERQISKIKFFLYDPITQEKILDEKGEPLEVSKDYEPQPDLDGLVPIVSKEVVNETKKVYSGPKVYPRNVKQVIVPKNADTADIQALDWVCDQYERTVDWLQRHIGEQEEGKFNEEVVVSLRQKVESKSVNRDNLRLGKVFISEWHGGYDVNGDGLDEEIVVFIGQPSINGQTDIKEAELLGWLITPYPKRPFFHYQIIPMDGSFYGKGIPEFLIGIRNLIDAIFNQMIDRGSITNNPPVIVPSDHDPTDKPFGPGVEWHSDNPNAYRVLELPKNEQMEFSKIEFLLQLVQKLFGVSDYSLGQDTGNQRTATGILSIIGEGNVKFDDMIRALQDVNEELYEFIVLLNSELLDDDFMYYLTEHPGNPFKKIAKNKWGGNFDFEAVGNSVNINREIEQNRAVSAYKTAMESYTKNPFINDSVMKVVTENYFRAIDMRNVKVPNIEEVKKSQIEMTAQAMIRAQQILSQQTLKGQAPPSGTVAPAGVGGIGG